jgi:chromosome partitioning protein
MITLVGSEKGGTGKTTIAINLAVCLAKIKKDVILIDTDKQPSASNFFAVRDENGVTPRVVCIQKNGRSLANDILGLSEKYEYVIIDAGGRDSAELRYSLGVTDQIIIPIQPTQLDLWTLDQMDILVRQAKALNPNLKRASVVLNMVSTNIGNTDAKEAAELINDYEELNILENHIKERVPFQRSIREGKGVVEYMPRAPKAYNEIMKLFKEVIINGI